MGWYFVSGRDRDGKSKTIRVDGADPNEALTKAGKRGLSDLQLETDEVSALYQAAPDEDDVFTDEEFVRFRRMTPLQNYFWLVGKLYSQVWVLAAGISIYLFVQSFWQNAWGTGDKILAGFGVVLILYPFVMPLIPTAGHRQLVLYRDLIRALVNANWNRVNELCDRLEETDVSRSEIAFRRAQATAHLGDFDAAMKIVQPWVDGTIDDPECPRSLALTRVSEIYDAAGRYEEGSACIEQACELADESALTWLDVGMRRSLDGDTIGTEQALERAKQFPISVEMQPIVNLLESCIANDRGQYHIGVELIEKVYGHCVMLCKAHEIWRLLMLRFDVELAISYAGTGQMETAAKYYRKAKRLIELHDDAQLRSRWETHLHTLKRDGVAS